MVHTMNALMLFERHVEMVLTECHTYKNIIINQQAKVYLGYAGAHKLKKD
jgi:hypothetical protein